MSRLKSMSAFGTTTVLKQVLASIDSAFVEPGIRYMPIHSTRRLHNTELATLRTSEYRLDILVAEADFETACASVVGIKQVTLVADFGYKRWYNFASGITTTLVDIRKNIVPFALRQYGFNQLCPRSSPGANAREFLCSKEQSATCDFLQMVHQLLSSPVPPPGKLPGEIVSTLRIRFWLRQSESLGPAFCLVFLCLTLYRLLPLARIERKLWNSRSFMITKMLTILGAIKRSLLLVVLGIKPNAYWAETLDECLVSGAFFNPAILAAEHGAEIANSCMNGRSETRTATISSARHRLARRYPDNAALPLNFPGRFIFSTSNGLWVYDQNFVHMIARGFFFGVTFWKDKWYAFESINNGGHILSFTINFGTDVPLMEERQYAFTGLSRGVHQIAGAGDRLCVIDTLHNRLLLLGTDKSKECVYPSGRLPVGLSSPNYRHFNAVFVDNEHYYVMAHQLTSKTKRPSIVYKLDRSNPGRGGVIAIEAADGHDILMEEGRLIYCDSAHGAVHWGDRTSIVCPGYLSRGLALTTSGLIVGCSELADRTRRKYSTAALAMVLPDGTIAGPMPFPRAGQIHQIQNIVER